MRFALPSLFALASVAVATTVVKDPNGRAANPTSPNPYIPENKEHSLVKRTCFLGLCYGTSTPDYTSDEYNCGQKGKVCSTIWTNGWGAQCSNGVCGPAYCYNLFDFNWLSGKCQDVSSDTSNCGKCGQTCSASSITGASAASCISGTCTASGCKSGYTLSSGTCTLNINTQTDLNNCGSKGNVCQSSWSYGTGRQCLAGVCQPASCNSGYDFNFSTNKCQNVQSDTSNCGKCGYSCSFPNGYGSCSSGSCTLSSCRSGFYKVDDKCTALDLSSDATNCGSVGNDCTSKYANGVGTCQSGTCALGTCADGYKATTQYSCSLFIFCSASTTCTKVDTSSDTDNCGTIGNKCAASYANGYNPTCSNGACSATCNNGYSWDSSLFYCRATTQDVNHCGACNNKCPSTIGTPQCKSGTCSYASCNTGYYLINGACTALTLSSDVNNCGAVGTKCPSSYPNGNGVTCASGVCRATTCNTGYDWDASTSTCRNVQSDIQHCGRCNNPCSFPNGSGTCSSGTCTLNTCNAGFQKVNGLCTSMDITSDINNCGAVGKVCSFPLGKGSCSSGTCTYTTCNSPYALKSGSCTAVDTNTDVNNCGAIGTVCPLSYNNGGAGKCVNGDCTTTCNSGFDFDSSLNYCRDVTSDVNNCGRCGGVCSLNGASSTKCVSSKCYATNCKSGYYLQGGVCNGIDTTSDSNNCGGIGKVCSFTPSGAVGSCKNSVCTVTSCPAGYIISSNVCVKSSASQRARAKKSKITAPKSLCPDHETACPIAGAASYAMAVSHHFSAFGDLTTGMDGAGGFECLDTTQALDSCGGCASTGEGQDCTKIPSAVGVGCDSGACVVFSCQAGWRPNLAGTKCIRAHHQHESSNSTRSHGSRRHLAARHGHHGHSHS